MPLLVLRSDWDYSRIDKRIIEGKRKKVKKNFALLRQIMSQGLRRADYTTETQKSQEKFSENRKIIIMNESQLIILYRLAQKALQSHLERRVPRQSAKTKCKTDAVPT